MNQLFVSFESQILELLQKLSKIAWKEWNIVEYYNPDNIDETYLMRLMNWADEVYCLTKADKKALSFMRIFEKKIQLLNLKFTWCMQCGKAILESDKLIWHTDFEFCSEACQKEFEKHCYECACCQTTIHEDDRIDDEDGIHYCSYTCLNLSRM